MRPFELFVERTLKDFENTLKSSGMSEAQRRMCVTCAKEFAAFLLFGETETGPKPR